ncbi:MAG: NADH-quinone oxidoreductase subunit N [Alphaproteobacteria bacterium]|nr:NADH-quinone oxidoreductase subunit N [Alphaproteobacteria bacterium]
MINVLNSLLLVLPELILGIFALGLLFFGVFQGDKSLRIVSYGTIIALVLATLSIFVESSTQTIAFRFETLILNDYYTELVQFLILFVALTVFWASFSHLSQNNLGRFEYPILFLLATLGMLLMVSANDCLLFFGGLELQSLSIYVMVALERERAFVSEAAIKYFILGTLSTILILYGFCFVYGYTGTTDFNGIEVALSAYKIAPLPIILAMVLIVSGLAFKVSAAPFHMWTPDVYEGSPTCVVLFLSSAPKIASMTFLVRLLFGVFGQFMETWQPLIMALAVITMILGVLAAVFQNNIKRLLAYSTISHVGFMLVGIAATSIGGVQSVIVYLTLYAVMVIGTFTCLLNLRHHGQMPETIDDLRGLSKTNKPLALALAILMFSLAGIPPLAGFFAKFLVFIAAINTGQYALVIVGILCSLIAASYYLRVIKVMYFEAPSGNGNVGIIYDRPLSQIAIWVIGSVVVINLLFFTVPEPLMWYANRAAVTLFTTE